MNMEMWAMFFLAYLVTTLSPGPNVLLVLKNSIRHGWRSAFITVLGNLTCQFLIVCLVAVGVGHLLAELPFWFVVMKTVGGAYLIFLGVKNLRAARKGKSAALAEAEAAPAAGRGRRSLFLEAFLVSASNPKTLIFLSAFLPQFLDTAHPVSEQFTVMFVTICGIVTSVHLGYSYLIASLGHRFSFKDFGRRIDKLTGGLFIAMGGGILLSDRV
ncbi:Homoserine/homoserine lactone efflux protein [Pseudodesulfovibrio hydrargyri]|uniref:Homoserine/homoserine lactone efflux protein n=1 Tax=Pseudodesulfovibrio hydrargyri TaxID=2125990 RepID=A0A1J5NL77_9BACT|nr:LysE family translocator [Pseudodesulfovibrio hydrargyri]OIQ52393.1 Homoserine/homoserine lactone efflux protein [Pseudodesulfovibrio hydrargyri]